MATHENEIPEGLTAKDVRIITNVQLVDVKLCQLLETEERIKELDRRIGVTTQAYLQELLEQDAQHAAYSFTGGIVEDNPRNPDGIMEG